MDFPIQIEHVIKIPLRRKKTWTHSSIIIVQLLHVTMRDEIWCIFFQESVNSPLKSGSAENKPKFNSVYADFTMEVPEKKVRCL